MEVVEEFNFIDYKTILRREKGAPKETVTVSNSESNRSSWNIHVLYPHASKEKLRAIEELYDTEKSYVDFLTAVEDVFVNNMNVHEAIPRKKRRSLYGDVSSLCQINTILLESLVMKPIPEAFTKLLPYLKLYTRYACQYPTLLKTYAEVMSVSSCKKVIEEAEMDSRCCGNRLPALLIMPVQRIPRYILLLDRLLVLTSDPHEREQLERVLFEMRQLSESMQDCMTTYENGEKLLEIQESFGLTRHIFEPGRRLLKKGVLYKREDVGDPQFQERIFYLFNDAILYGKRKFVVAPTSKTKYEPCCLIALRHCEIEHNEMDGSFYLSCEDVRIVVTADTYDRVQEWYEGIFTAIKRAKILRKTLRKESQIKKVIVFEQGFWSKRKNALKSFYTNDVNPRVQRVLSRRRTIRHTDEEEDYTEVEFRQERKRKIGTDENNDIEVGATFRKKTWQMITEEFESKIQESRVTQRDPLLQKNENNLKTNNMEIKRQPTLAMKDIRKLSYQEEFTKQPSLDDTVEDEEERDEQMQLDEDYDEVDFKIPKRIEQPWWANESAPPLIKEQKVGLIDSIKSKCVIM